MTETISANGRRFISVDDTDAFVQAQQNENTRRMTDCHIKLLDRMIKRSWHGCFHIGPISRSWSLSALGYRLNARPWYTGLWKQPCDNL